MIAGIFDISSSLLKLLSETSTKAATEKEGYVEKLEQASGDDVFKVGGETVLFRHEKTFVNPPGIAVQITDAMSDGEITARLDSYAKLQYERVGLNLKPDLIAIKSANGDEALQHAQAMAQM